MGIKDQAKRLAAGASVALATSGLSNCKDGGGFCDPAPEPLQCSLASQGQTLTARGTVSGSRVDVTVVGTGDVGIMVPTGWQVDTVSNVQGATLSELHLPRPRSQDSLRLVLTLPPGGTRASFSVTAHLFGWMNESCYVQRTFNVDVTAIGVSVHEAQPSLPLSARDSAHIALLSQEGRTVQLAASTTFAGPRRFSWRVSGGALDAFDASPVRWTLPAEPGLYQAELVIDYGDAGLAIDHLALEVS